MNLFWPIYKNLEKELINLSNIVHFDDHQENVYSIYIADLLVRTSVEIEAISKYLYEVNGGDMSPFDGNGDPRPLYFDTDCIKFLDLKWKITKKVVNVAAPTFYFEKSENRILHPLKNCNKQKNGRWKKAYQAVKHERVKKLAQGNIGNLIRATAALYLLNVYCFDDKIQDLNTGTIDIDARLGSEVFSVNTFRATSLSMSDKLDDSWIIDEHDSKPYNIKENCVLIDKYTNDSIKDMFERNNADSIITRHNAENSPQIKDFLAEHPDYLNKSLNEICIRCGEEIERRNLGIKEGADISAEQKELIHKAGIQFFTSIFSFSNMTSGKPAARELIINKEMPIYPTISGDPV